MILLLLIPSYLFYENILRYFPFKTAYTLRAQYDFLKGMDALQISVAIEKDCEQFLTNDRKLRRISEIDVILVEDI